MLLRPLCDSQQTNNHPEASFTCWWGWFGLLVCRCVDGCFGGHSGGETPGLIPNPEAKPSSADGTAPGRVWESRTPPDSTSVMAHPGPGWAITIPTPDEKPDETPDEKGLPATGRPIFMVP